MATKIVAIGDVNGRFSELFSKLAGLQAKQSFAYAIIVGNLFASPDQSTEALDEELSKLLDGKIDIPLPVYFSLGNLSLPETVTERLTNNSGELCPNLTILGRRVSIKTSEGHKILAIGGAHVEQADEPMSEFAATYSDKDVESAKSFPEPHLLITSEWPAGILKQSKKTYAGQLPKGVPSLRELCAVAKPRYHFTTSPAFFEREAFLHDPHAPTPSVTRFISLAPFGNPDKQKWIYAFTFDPDAAPPTQGLTRNPFRQPKRKHEAGEPSESTNIRFSNGNGSVSERASHDRRAPKRHHGNVRRECYFCLSNPTCETHMITAIGASSYMTIAKGPLSDRTTFPSLGGLPAHMLIVPVVHAATLDRITTDTSGGGGERAATRAEMQRFRDALQTLVAAKSTVDGAEGAARLGSVTWEISRAQGVHLHWQFLPVPADLIERGLVEAGFEVEAENQGFGAWVKDPVQVAALVGGGGGGDGDRDRNGDRNGETKGDGLEEESKESGNGEGGKDDGDKKKKADRSAAAPSGDYFRAMLWTEAGGQKEIVLPLDGHTRFDLQFGRRVLAKLLGVERRAHWQDCAQTQAEEEVDAEAFKAAFEQYDFSRVS